MLVVFQVTENSIVYSNKLYYESKKRTKTFITELQCLMPKTVYTKQGISSTSKTNNIVTGRAKVLIDMDLYGDDVFTQRLEVNPDKKRKNIFVELRLNTTDTALSISPRECYVVSKSGAKTMVLRNR